VFLVGNINAEIGKGYSVGIKKSQPVRNSLALGDKKGGNVL